MDVKETEAMVVLSASRRLTIAEIKRVSSEITGQIDAEIARGNLEVAGPWVFVARHLPRDSKTEFELRFCRPVRNADGYDGPFAVECLEPIMVASAMHQGSMRTLPWAAKLMRPSRSWLISSQNCWSDRWRRSGRFSMLIPTPWCG